MSSSIQLKRRIGGAQAAPAGANVEGELAVFFPGAAGGTGRPTLYANDGGGFRIMNPETHVSVQSVNVPINSAGNTLSQDIAALPMTTLNHDSVVVFDWNGSSYLYTGNADSIGTGTPVVPAGDYLPVGAATKAPQVLDWSARVEPDIGAAYTAWHGGAGTPDFTGSPVFIAWTDHKLYILSDVLNPSSSASYIAISAPPGNPQVADFTAVPTANNATDIGSAYTAFIAAGQTLDVKAGTTIVKWGATSAAYYILTDPTAPAVAGNWSQISPDAVAALDFKAAVDVTQPRMDDADPTSPVGWASGSFALIAASGTTSTATNTGGKSWADIGVPATINQGDLMIWDGTAFHILALETDLSAYLQLAGGTMADGAGIIFDTTTAAAGAGAATVIIIDGKGGSLKDVVVDAGTY